MGILRLSTLPSTPVSNFFVENDKSKSSDGTVYTAEVADFIMVFEFGLGLGR